VALACYEAASNTRGRAANAMYFLDPAPSRTYETSELGARRSFRHVLND
jgi:hypothetical protein